MKSHISESIVTYDRSLGVLRDCDYLDDFNYLALFGSVAVYPDDRKIYLNLSIGSPIIRIVNESCFLIIISRVESQVENAYIVSATGDILSRFRVGDGVEDVIVKGDHIIVSYFDEGVFGSDGPNNEGLSIFDLSGKYLFGVNTMASGRHIYDCYCMCNSEDESIYYFAYDNFNLTRLSLYDFTLTEFVTPGVLEGAHALAKVGGGFIFHSTYEDSNGIYSWKPGDKEAFRIGEYSAKLMSAGSSCMISKGDWGFTIVKFHQSQ